MVTSEMRNHNFELISYGNNLVELETWFGLKIVYQAHAWSLNIYVPDSYGVSNGDTPVLEGLCGNYNQEMIDDSAGRDGVIYSSNQQFEWGTR